MFDAGDGVGGGWAGAGRAGDGAAAAWAGAKCAATGKWPDGTSCDKAALNIVLRDIEPGNDEMNRAENWQMNLWPKRVDDQRH